MRTSSQPAARSRTIDRAALVRRHNVAMRKIDPCSPLTVGNGEFAFTFDATGLQTLPDAYPAPGRYGEPAGSLLGTQSQWGWHSTPIGAVPELASTVRTYASPRGPVPYVDLGGRTSATALESMAPAESWLRNNPHRLMLGRIGLAPQSAGLRAIGPADVVGIDQTLDLWTGVATSSFQLGGAGFTVETAVDPEVDAVSFRVRSAGGEPPAVVLDFPYGSEAWGNAADGASPERHASELRTTARGWDILRRLDEARYAVVLNAPGARVTREGAHRFVVVGGGPVLELTVGFLPGWEPGHASVPSFADVATASSREWERYWMHGGMVQLAESADPRAAELERRVILSQYQTRVQCAGSLPPQETGLMVNSWRGRFHLEMHWWHAAHFAVWNRPELVERSLGWYETILGSARETAAAQGFPGARWPKQVGPDGRESPSDIGPFLIWQQPHPIYLAELVFRSRPNRATAERYASVVFATAEFMAGYAHRGPDGFELGPPLIPAQESYAADRAGLKNPTFELAYWAWALDAAQRWRARLGLAPHPVWDEVARNLVRPTVRDGVYAAIGVPPFTVRTDHPSMLAGLGVIPPTRLIDPSTMSRTLDDVLRDWDWESTWGWDYPMIAMCAARLGRPNDAVDALLLDRGKNTYLRSGHNFQTEALPLYLPGNGGLLAAVALMAAGWDGSGAAPGFPADGSWRVQVKDVLPLP
ncbi:hypothetical protein [Sinomonas sp. P47F7]|uniref:hypothetical protein n=1 Tax=Sinomonas sp. P47F7 TaxID=3410987 RepID=UPI003BF49F96